MTAEGSILICGDVEIPLKHNVGQAEAIAPMMTRDSFSRFNKTPACDGRTERHRVIGKYTALCICVAYVLRAVKIMNSANV